MQSSFYKRAIEISWLLVIFFIPISFNPQSYMIFSVIKTSLFQFLVIAMLAFWVADWISSRASYKGLKWQGFLASPLHLPILIFGLLSVLATAASITPAISFWGDWERKAGLLTLLCWILFFLIVAQQIQNRTQLFRAVYTLLLSSGVVSVLGILQYFFPDLMFSVFHSHYTSRITSTIGNPLFLSNFLAMVIPFNLALIVYSWSRRKEGSNTKILISLVILLALQFWCLWLAQYYVTILLYVISLIIFVLLLGIVKRKKILLGLGAVSLLTLIVVAALLMVPLLFTTPRIDTQTPQNLEPSTHPENIGLKTLGFRVQFWHNTVDMLLKSPEVPFSNDRLHFLRKFIGYGQETFVITFQQFFPEKLKSDYTHRAVGIDRPHNDYLYLAATVGLLGLMSFLSILAVFFWLCFRYLLKATSDIDKLLLIAMAAAIVQYMADIFFNPSTISPELVFWLTLSFVPVMGRLTIGVEPERALVSDSTGLDGSQKTYVNRIRRYVSVGCALLLILIGLGITIRPVLANMYLQRGLSLQKVHIGQSLYAFEKATKIEPGEANNWNFLGEYSYSVARNINEEPLKIEALSLATGAYDKALEASPYLSLWYHALADIYTYWASIGATDKWPISLSLYDKASQLFPRNAVILNKWSLALIIKGDLNEARTKLDYAASIDPDWAETSFLYGLLLAKQGENNEAAIKITEPIRDKSANLNYFIDLCHHLSKYDMVHPLDDTLKLYTQTFADDWTARALLGTTSMFGGNIDKSVDELNASMLLVPVNDVDALFRAILRLSAMSQEFKIAIPNVATEWRDKLAQSPERDTLLPALDKLVGTTE